MGKACIMTDETPIYALARLAQQKAVVARRRKLNAVLRPSAPSAATHKAHSPAQKTGRKSEEKASQYLQDRGLTILGQNLSNKTGEIDLVAADNDTLVFVEVRHRHSSQYGGAAASVNRNKQARLIKTAQYFLPVLTRRFFHGRTPACRFDVISVESGRLSWIKNAFVHEQ